MEAHGFPNMHPATPILWGIGESACRCIFGNVKNAPTQSTKIRNRTHLIVRKVPFTNGKGLVRSAPLIIFAINVAHRCRQNRNQVQVVVQRGRSTIGPRCSGGMAINYPSAMGRWHDSATGIRRIATPNKIPAVLSVQTGEWKFARRPENPVHTKVLISCLGLVGRWSNRPWTVKLEESIGCSYIRRGDAGCSGVRYHNFSCGV